jgi:hypothetical protein
MNESRAMAGLFEIKSKTPDVERGMQKKINHMNIVDIPIDILMIIFGYNVREIGLAPVDG